MINTHEYCVWLILLNMQYYNNFSYCVWLILMNMQYYNNFSYCVWYYNTFLVYAVL